VTSPPPPPPQQKKKNSQNKPSKENYPTAQGNFSVGLGGIEIFCIAVIVKSYSSVVLLSQY